MGDNIESPKPIKLLSIKDFNRMDINSKIERLGIDEKELYYLDFKKFKSNNPDIFGLPPEIQKIRWNHINKNRRNLLEEVTREREKIINSLDDEFENGENDNKLRTSKNFYLSNINNAKSSSVYDKKSKSQISNRAKPLNFSSTFSFNNFKKSNIASNEEKKMMEKFIERQKLEAHNIIEFEIKQQLLRKEQEEITNKEKLEEDKNRRDLIREIKLKDLDERKKELYENIKEAKEIISLKNNKENKENENIQDREENLYFGMIPEEAIELIEENIRQINDEINRVKQEDFDEKRRKKQMKIKENEISNKHKNFHEKCHKEYIMEYQKSHEIRKLEEIKEKKRLSLLEEKRIKKIQEHEKSINLHKKRYEENNNKLEEKLEKKSEIISKKLLMSKENREHFEDLRKIAMKKKVETHLRKQEEMKSFIEKNKGDLETLRERRWKKKMQEMEKQKKQFDKERETKIKEKNMELKVKAIKTEKLRKLREEEIVKEGAYTMIKIKNFFFKSQRKKESNEREQMLNSENLQKKRTDVIMKNKRIENVKEIERQKALENIQELYKKSEIFMDHKNYISNKKRVMAIELSNKRKEALEKFDNYLHNNKEINADLIRKLFPSDDDLLEKFYLLNEQSQMNRSIYKSTSHVCNASIKKITNQNLCSSKLMRSKDSFRSAGSIGLSRILNKSKGFSSTGFSAGYYNNNMNTNMNVNKTNKYKLEPLIEDISRSQKNETSRNINNNSNNIIDVNKSYSRNTNANNEKGKDSVVDIKIETISNKERGSEIKKNDRINIDCERRSSKSDSNSKDNKEKDISKKSINNSENNKRNDLHNDKDKENEDNNENNNNRFVIENHEEEKSKKNESLDQEKEKEKENEKENDEDKEKEKSIKENSKIEEKEKDQSKLSIDKVKNMENSKNENESIKEKTIENKDDKENNNTNSNENNENEKSKASIDISQNQNELISSSKNSRNKSLLEESTNKKQKNLSENITTEKLLSENNNVNNNKENEEEKKKNFERELEKKLHLHKIKLNKEMLKILKDEKSKENKRNMLYGKATNDADKRRLENLIALERVESTEKIIKINEENEKKLKEYELLLRKEFENENNKN